MNELEWAFEERIRLLLEDEEWHKAEKLCSEKLSSFPNNAYACLGLLMAGHRISSIDKINEFPEIVNDLLYQKLLANADESLIQKLKTSFFKPEKNNLNNNSNLSEQKSFTPSPTPNNENINLTQLFKRALLALEDGDFAGADRFAENILNNDAENAQAYLIKLMIENRVKNRSDLGRLPKSFEDSGNFKKAIRFGNQELKDELNGYLEQIEHNIKYPVYAHGCEEMKKGDIASLEKAISVFNGIIDFKDSKSKIAECKSKIKDITYDKACEKMSQSSIESNEEAIKLFSSLIDLGSTFKNSGNNIEICRLNIKKIKYNYACMAMEEKSYEKAISIFASISDYEDSKEKLKECEKREKKEKQKSWLIALCIILVFFVAGFISKALEEKKYNENIAKEKAAEEERVRLATKKEANEKSRNDRIEKETIPSTENNIEATTEENEEWEPIELHMQVAAESMIDDLNTVTGIELIKCNTGSFIMGSSINELGRNKDEQQHKVIISNPFYIGKYEVTQKIYEAVVGNNPSKFKDPNKPVESVSWDDAVKFCEILNKKYSRYIPSGYKFDLPTEAQWEYACRAGTNTPLNNGKNLTTINGACPNLNEIAWYDKNANGTTHKVGQKKPNTWGIYDMHGNVWEWCKDLYGEYPTEYVTDPAGAKSGSSRVYRGGSWGNNASFSRSSYRCSSESDLKRMRLGFRVVLVLDQNYLLNIGDNWERAIPGKRSVSEIPNNITYKKYTNVRFGYSVDYPDFMIPNGESDNGDGQRFYFDSETYIAVWASYNLNGLEEEYNLCKEVTDSYTVLKKNWFIRSGLDSTNHIYYRKTILDNNKLCTMYFYYPSESKTKFDKIINGVTKSIKVSLSQNTR